MGKIFLWGALIISLCILLLFPIVITTDAYYLLRSKKIAFSIRLFGKIKIVGGYLSTYEGGVAIHISDAKAIILGYKEMEERGKSFSFKKLFTLKKFSLHIRTGAEYFLPLYAVEQIRKIIGRIKPSVQKKTEARISLVNGDVLQVATRLSVTTTVLRQIKILIIYLWRRMISKWKMKKLTV